MPATEPTTASNKALTEPRIEEAAVMETPDGVGSASNRPGFAEQMELAESVMHENQDVLGRLAR